MDTIGLVRKFYGRLRGIRVEEDPQHNLRVRLIATFLAGETESDWLITDIHLYDKLVGILREAAAEALSTGQAGYFKVDIWHDGEVWRVEDVS